MIFLLLNFLISLRVLFSAPLLILTGLIILDLNYLAHDGLLALRFHLFQWKIMRRVPSIIIRKHGRVLLHIVSGI